MCLYASILTVAEIWGRKFYKSGCLQLLEILEISWNLNGPPGNFCVMIENFILWLMALLHDDVALFVH